MVSTMIAPKTDAVRGQTGFQLGTSEVVRRTFQIYQGLPSAHRGLGDKSGIHVLSSKLIVALDHTVLSPEERTQLVKCMGLQEHLVGRNLYGAFIETDMYGPASCLNVKLAETGLSELFRKKPIIAEGLCILDESLASHDYRRLAGCLKRELLNVPILSIEFVLHGVCCEYTSDGMMHVEGHVYDVNALLHSAPILRLSGVEC